jgi:hypothetical protein
MENITEKVPVIHARARRGGMVSAGDVIDELGEGVLGATHICGRWRSCNAVANGLDLLSVGVRVCAPKEQFTKRSHLGDRISDYRTNKYVNMLP